ncbi:MAG: CDP-diacylglycerol--serine O-phosphatidyltransferase [candidate division Zixibacteria bacterium]|nr:CDP-diacylglycerol--serine O-phosphatidyltransferase [candidate division Zixibacteria bacterium]
MPNYRPIFPNIFTAGNIFCGFLSLISAAEGEPTHAAWLIILAGFLDGLDGKVARLSGGASALGKELDSLADFISFGVAPAFLIYTFGLNGLGKWGWIIGLVYITAAGYRLARFNLLATSDEKKHFLGLPVPGAGVTLAAYIIFCYAVWDKVEYGEYLVSMMIIFSALMVSQIEYEAMPDKFNTRVNRRKLLYIVILAVAVLIRPRLLMFPILLLYIATGLIKEAIRIVKITRSGRGDDLEQSDDDEDGPADDRT